MAGLASRLVAGWLKLPALAQIGIIYVVGRAITLAFLLGAAGASTSLSRFGADPTLADLILGWDSRWYWIVADVGYPHELPLNDAGQPAENAWAFMPLYAYLAKLISLPFGSWVFGAAILSMVAGFGACVMLYRLLALRITHTQALWSVVFFANGPLAALFHVGYAEGLFLFFLLAALYALVSRNFWWLYPLIILMGYTRPGVLAFALLLGLYGIWRWFRRAQDPLPASQIIHIVALGLLATVVGFSWQLLAGAVMGDPTAYLQTELSWRRNWIPDSAAHFIPFDGWILGLNFWFGQFHIPALVGWIAFAVVLVATIVFLVRARSARALGMEVRLWSASYLLYLLAVFFPQSSTLRLLIPLTPLWGAAGQIKSRWIKIALVVLCLGYQCFWIYEMYAFGNTITRIP